MGGQGYQRGIDVTIPTVMIIAGFFAISIHNTIEINAQIFLTFKKYTGFYFWSLLASSWGIALHSLGFLLKFFRLCENDYVNIVIITLGGVPMVIGQSVVLYSRLHLVVQDRGKTRWVLIMIISSFVLFTIPPTVLNFGSNSPNPDPFVHPFEVYEKIALVGFCSQEFTISGLYLWHTWNTLRHSRGNDARQVMKHLIFVNVIVILMDFTLLGTVFGNMYAIETTYKSALYSIKLKLEFPILNQFRNLVQKRRCSCGYSALYISSPESATEVGQGYYDTVESNGITIVGATPRSPRHNGTAQISTEEVKDSRNMMATTRMR